MTAKPKKAATKIGLALCAAAAIGSIASACGAPASNKYLTSVSQFTNLSRYPNPDPALAPEEAGKLMTVHYSVLNRGGQNVTRSWSYQITNGPTETTPNQPLTNQVDTAFVNIYGNLVDTFIYGLANPAALFATSVANYNAALERDGKPDQTINLFRDETGQPVPSGSQFYKAMANNLLVANSDQNIAFGVSDVTFNFRQIDPTTGTFAAGGEIFDARKNNTAFANAGGDITDDTTAMSENNVNNRLTKIYAITDIAIYFRFFVAGADQGSVAPSRNAIVKANPVDATDAQNQQVLQTRFQATFGEQIQAYSYKLTLNDMVASMFYVAADVARSETDQTLTYKLVPSSVRTLAPISWMNDATVEGKQNVLLLDAGLRSALADQSAILTPQQYQNADLSEQQQRQETLVGWDNAIQTQTAAFAALVSNSQPDVAGMKDRVVKLRSDPAADNYLGFTAENYFAQYFKALVPADADGEAYAENIG